MKGEGKLVWTTPPRRQDSAPHCCSAAGRPRALGTWVLCVPVIFTVGYLKLHICLNFRPVALNTLCMSTMVLLCRRPFIDQNISIPILHLQPQDTEVMCLKFTSYAPFVIDAKHFLDNLLERHSISQEKVVRSEGEEVTNISGNEKRYRTIQASTVLPRPTCLWVLGWIYTTPTRLPDSVWIYTLALSVLKWWLKNHQWFSPC